MCVVPRSDDLSSLHFPLFFIVFSFLPSLSSLKLKNGFSGLCYPCSHIFFLCPFLVTLNSPQLFSYFPPLLSSLPTILAFHTSPVPHILRFVHSFHHFSDFSSFASIFSLLPLFIFSALLDSFIPSSFSPTRAYLHSSLLHILFVSFSFIFSLGRIFLPTCFCECPSLTLIPYF